MLMLTILSHLANFPPLMQVKQKKIFILIVGISLLQSCYTMVNPPQTLPQSVTTIISEPAMASSFGGAGVYGWDPYWEPALPFTNYHRGYGASYYSPYNYYDYHHPYYAPVYISGEVNTSAPGREFGRDDPQGGARDRELTGSGTVSGSSGRNGSTGQESGMSSTGPGIILPVTPPSVSNPPYKTVVSDKTSNAAPPSQQITPIKINDSPPVKNQQQSRGRQDSSPPKKQITPSNNIKTQPQKSGQNTDSSEASSPTKKRTRTRK